jgi:hypothetical protein
MAQDDEESAKPYVYATYFNCDATRLSEVDELMTRTAPIYKQAVADGQIANWGWLGHHTGGAWRRLFYAVGSDANGLMDALDALGDKTSEVEGAEAFGEICGTHEDYLWRQASSSAESAAGNPGAVGLSVYYECNFNTEGFADTIVETFFAPIFNAHVGDGKLVSWSWLEHQMGGKFRRLLAMRAADRSDLMTTWGAIIEDLSEEQDGALRAFSDICFSHEDYLWLSGN